MQFSKELLAQIHIKLDTEGLNSLSEKEVIVLLAEQNRDSTEFLAEQIQGGNERVQQTQDKILNEVTQSRQTQDKILNEVTQSRQTQDEILTEVSLSRKAQDKILTEIAQIGQTLFGMLQTQDKMLQVQDKMLQEMYQSRQAQEKWQQK